MDAKVKEWIQLARRISKHILTMARDRSMDRNNLDEGEIPAELKIPEYYIQKAIRKQELDKKYTWDEFLSARRAKGRQQLIRNWRYAASVVILIGAGCILWLNPSQTGTLISVVNQPGLVAGEGKASLILSDGREVFLNDEMALTEKDGTIIQNKESGELSYQTGNLVDTTLQYNTIRVPRGGEYRLVLPDGTKVWVNSDSELKFPTHFAAGKREVFLQGEAYFEITPDKSHPFYVHSHDLKIHATGTAFDVMAYQDESEMKVILVEGGVNIENQHNIITKLTPSNEFCINKSNGEFQITSVDMRTATGWKDGIFFFNDEPLSSIIRKLSRWYNIEIQCVQPELYQYKFSGSIRKYEDADEVLNMLKLTNEITYRIQPDKKILIYTVE